MSQALSFIAGGLFGGVYMWWRIKRDLVRMVREELQSNPMHVRSIREYVEEEEGMGTRGEWTP